MNKLMCFSNGSGDVIKSKKCILEYSFTDEDIKSQLSRSRSRLFDFSLSEIDPDNNQFTFLLRCDEYCDLHGLSNEGGRAKAELKEDILFFKTQQTPILLLDDETGIYCKIYHTWFQDVREYGRTTDGSPMCFQITVNKAVALEMINDPGRMMYPTIYSCRIKANQALFAYNFFRANGVFDQPFNLTLAEFAKCIHAKTYSEWFDFRRRQLQPVIEDINCRSLDMLVFWEPVYDQSFTGKGRKPVTAIQFTVHLVIKPINIHEICEDEPVDYQRLENLKLQIDYEGLRKYFNPEKADIVLSSLYAANIALENNGSLVASKFGYTVDKLQEIFNSMSPAVIRMGAETAFKKRKQADHLHAYIFYCILQEYEKAASSPDQMPVWNNMMSSNIASQQLLPETIAEKRKTAPELMENSNVFSRAPKRPRVTKAELRAAEQRVAELYNENKIREALTSPIRKFSPERMQILNENNPELYEALLKKPEIDPDVLEIAIYDFYNALRTIFATKAPEINIGQLKVDNVVLRGSTSVTPANFKKILEDDSLTGIHFAVEIIKRYAIAYENLERQESEKARCRYITTMMWNEIWMRQREKNYR